MIQFYEMQKQVKHIYMSEVREWLPLGERVTGRGHKRGFCNVGNFFWGGAGYMGWLTFWKFTLMILYFSAGSHTSKTFF